MACGRVGWRELGPSLCEPDMSKGALHDRRMVASATTHRIATPGSPRSSRRNDRSPGVRVLLLSSVLLWSSVAVISPTNLHPGVPLPFLSIPASRSGLADSDLSSNNHRLPALEFDSSQVRAMHRCSGSLAANSGCSPRSLPVLSVGASTASSGWENLTARLNVSPPGLEWGMMAYDPQGGFDLLFGGYNASTRWSNQTWTYQNGTWSELHLTVHPPAMDAATMAWDPLDDYVVLFGGSDGYFPFNQTWIFKSGQWSELSSSPAPPARWRASMAWDSSDGYLVLFGGCDTAGNTINDTWTFVHGNWSELNESTAPSPRWDASMANNPDSGTTILYGGWAPTTSGVTYFNDTWTFQGGTWKALVLAITPLAEFSPYAAFDSSVGSILVFGGCGPADSTFAGLWSFNGAQWLSVNATGAPNSRCLGMAATDPSRGGIVLFGGYHTWSSTQTFNDTWEYYTVQPVVNASPDRWDGMIGSKFSVSSPGGQRPLSYEWTFGDGSTSAMSNPQHAYALPGTYNVSVTVADALGIRGSASINVTQLPAMSVAVVASPLTGRAPLVVNASASTAGGLPPYVFFWGYPAGRPAPSLSSNTSVTYSTPGDFVLQLMVSDSLNYTVERTFNVTVLPALSIAPLSVEIFANQTSCAAPCLVGFESFVGNGSGPFSVNWTFGNGQVSSTVATSTEYFNAGSYFVLLRASNRAGQAGNATLTITVGPELAVTANYSVRSDGPPITVQFNMTASGGVSPYVYVWAFGDGSGSAVQNPSHDFADGGSFRATAEVIDASGRHVTFPLSLALVAGNNASSPPPGSSGGISTEGWELAGGLAIVGLVVGAVVTWVVKRRPPSSGSPSLD